MTHPPEITIRLQSIDQILLNPNNSFYSKRLLKEDAEDYIIEEASSLHHTAPIILKVIIPNNETQKTEEIITAIHRHFSNRRQKSSEELKRMLHLGWRSLLIAFLFLTVMYVLTQIINNVLPENGFIITIRESIIILGWVAFWRPTCPTNRLRRTSGARRASGAHHRAC